MSWFNDQIEERQKNDDELMEKAFAEMAGAVLGKNSIASALNDKKSQTRDAVGEILKYYRVPVKEVPDELNDMNDILEFLLRPSGIMRRNVELGGKWYADGIGPMLAQVDEGRVVALIPSKLFGYDFYDPADGKRKHVTAKLASRFGEDAICFYKPLPLKKIKPVDFLAYIHGALSASDYILVVLATLAVTLIGMLSAYANNIIFSKVITDGRMHIFAAALVLLLGVSISTGLISITKELALSRISTKVTSSVQAAMMMRVLSLPASFFKKFSSGDLAGRTMRATSLCDILISVILTTCLSAVFSLSYFAQIVHYAPSLAAPALLGVLITTAVLGVSSYVQSKTSRKEIEFSSKESGLVFSYISGIQKIKLTGAEKRAFSKWANIYKESAKIKYDPPAILKFCGVIVNLTLTVTTAAIYYFAVKSNIAVSEFMAFNVSFGMVSGALLSVSISVMDVARIKPIFESLKPIFETVPEVSEGKRVVTRLSGGIELSNVSFRYDENMPMVIDNLSLKIRPGQYVAIVGTTGCGKSTLMRLMLGFELPQKGAVYYDGKDLSDLDLKSLRRNIGTVMQNGKLFQGDIFSNIVISAPWLKMDDAWEAAEKSGIADDIRRMPMGMHTIISEGSGGISGGQRQRLMIARAIAPKPKILMFDEATSALDNITQKQVSDSLESLKCTRIVIAHRLSTIKSCDRIILLDKGKIAEDGTYEELIKKNGAFAELVEKQRIDIDS